MKLYSLTDYKLSHDVIKELPIALQTIERFRKQLIIFGKFKLIAELIRHIDVLLIDGTNLIKQMEDIKKTKGYINE